MGAVVKRTGIIYREGRTWDYSGVSITLVVEGCSVCGIVFGVPKDFQGACYRDGGSMYCPNGHSLGWSETEADRQRSRAEAAEAELVLTRRQRETARVEAEHQKRVAAGHKAWSTRIANRIKNGICPWCNRSFAKLHQHIESKHPEQFAEHAA